jgi:hypothetical protein
MKCQHSKILQISILNFAEYLKLSGFGTQVFSTDERFKSI